MPCVNKYQSYGHIYHQYSAQIAGLLFYSQFTLFSLVCGGAAITRMIRAKNRNNAETINCSQTINLRNEVPMIRRLCDWVHTQWLVIIPALR